MKVYITSVGEETTDLCKWSLERNGFKDIHLIKDPETSLAEKLKLIYTVTDDDFLRVDADVIVNKNCTPEVLKANSQKGIWWSQFRTYGWFKQDLAWGGVQFIKMKAVPVLFKNIDKFLDAERPETQMYRLDEFDNPRRCISIDICMGIQNYGVKDAKRVMKTKSRRGQFDDYDFELAQELSKL